MTLAVDRDRGAAVLRWKASPTGRKPAKYRIYGSDEKGFTASDEPYKALVGISKVVSPDRPANFVTEVSGTEAAVIGADVQLPNANRAYYRVVAVDERATAAALPISPRRRGPSSGRVPSPPPRWDPHTAMLSPPSARSATCGLASWTAKKR